MGDELNLENIEPKATFEPQTNELNFDAPKSPSGGTKDYKKLENKPSINGIELVGDKTTEELGIETDSDIGIITEFDIEYTYEDNEVYNANAIHQLMEIFGFEIMNLVEVLDNHEERISALENK